MKTLKLILSLLFLIFFGKAHAQTLDRAVISSGGIVSDTINGTIGEVFVFNLSANGVMSLSSGSQSDTGYTGGLPVALVNSKTNQQSILVYPNPVDAYVHLQINGLKAGTVTFHVFDASGKMVLQHDASAVNKIYNIPVKQLRSGNYYIAGFTTSGESIGKIEFIKL